MKARWQTIAVTTWRNDKWYGGWQPLSALTRKCKPTYDCVLIFFSVVLILKILCPFPVLLWNKSTYIYIHLLLYWQTCTWMHPTVPVNIWCLLKPTKPCFRKSSQASSSVSTWPCHLGLLQLASEMFPPSWNVDCCVNDSVGQTAKFQNSREEEHFFIMCPHLAAPCLHGWCSLNEELM